MIEYGRKFKEDEVSKLLSCFMSVFILGHVNSDSALENNNHVLLKKVTIKALLIVKIATNEDVYYISLAMYHSYQKFIT